MKIFKGIKDIHIRIIVVIFGAIYPFLLLLSGDLLPSISSYWTSSMQPLFVLANAMTSYYLFNVTNWRGSAIFLLLLTAFSIEYYRNFHLLLAVMFFVINIYPLMKTRHFRWVIWIYLCSLPVLYFFGMFWAEVVAIEALCLYQGLVIRKINQINLQRQ